MSRKRSPRIFFILVQNDSQISTEDTTRLPVNDMRGRIALQVNALDSFRSSFTCYDIRSFCPPSLSQSARDLSISSLRRIKNIVGHSQTGLLTRRQIAYFIFTHRHTRMHIGRFYKRNVCSLNASDINKRLKIKCTQIREFGWNYRKTENTVKGYFLVFCSSYTIV